MKASLFLILGSLYWQECPDYSRLHMSYVKVLQFNARKGRGDIITQESTVYIYAYTCVYMMSCSKPMTGSSATCPKDLANIVNVDGTEKATANTPRPMARGGQKIRCMYVNRLPPCPPLVKKAKRLTKHHHPLTVISLHQSVSPFRHRPVTRSPVIPASSCGVPVSKRQTDSPTSRTMMVALRWPWNQTRRVLPHGCSVGGGSGDVLCPTRSDAVARLGRLMNLG